MRIISKITVILAGVVVIALPAMGAQNSQTAGQTQLKVLKDQLPELTGRLRGSQAAQRAFKNSFGKEDPRIRQDILDYTSELEKVQGEIKVLTSDPESFTASPLAGTSSDPATGLCSEGNGLTASEILPRLKKASLELRLQIERLSTEAREANRLKKGYYDDRIKFLEDQIAWIASRPSSEQGSLSESRDHWKKELAELQDAKSKAASVDYDTQIEMLKDQLADARRQLRDTIESTAVFARFKGRQKVTNKGAVPTTECSFSSELVGESTYRGKYIYLDKFMAYGPLSEEEREFIRRFSPHLGARIRIE